MVSIGNPKPLLYSSAVFAAIAFLLFLGFLAQIGLFAFLYLFGALLPAIGAVLAVAFILFPPYTRVSVVPGALAFFVNCALVGIFLYFAVPR